MKLEEISYPVFKLKNDRPIVENGVVLYITSKIDSDDNEIINHYIVDDTNVPGDTLGRRRLKLKTEGVKLFRLNKAIFFIGDLVKVANSKTWFIDNNGKIFNYKKETRAKLSFHKIIKVFHIPSGGVIVEVEGIATRFKAMNPPNVDCRFAGILHSSKSLILYGFYDKKYKETWRGV